MDKDTQPQAGKAEETRQEPAQAAESKPTVQATEGTKPPQPQAAQAEDLDALPTWAQRMVRDLRRENASHRKQVESAEKSAAEQQGKFQELYEKEQQERKALEAKLRDLELSDVRRKAGVKYGLPDALAARLRGDDEDAIFADAKIVAAALPKQVAANDARNGTGAATAPETFGGMTLDQVAQRYGIKIGR